MKSKIVLIQNSLLCLVKSAEKWWFISFIQLRWLQTFAYNIIQLFSFLSWHHLSLRYGPGCLDYKRKWHEESDRHDVLQEIYSFYLNMRNLGRVKASGLKNRVEGHIDLIWPSTRFIQSRELSTLAEIFSDSSRRSIYSIKLNLRNFG